MKPLTQTSQTRCSTTRSRFPGQLSIWVLKGRRSNLPLPTTWHRLASVSWASRRVTRWTYDLSPRKAHAPRCTTARLPEMDTRAGYRHPTGRSCFIGRPIPRNRTGNHRRIGRLRSCGSIKRENPAAFQLWLVCTAKLRVPLNRESRSREFSPSCCRADNGIHALFRDLSTAALGCKGFMPPASSAA